MAPPHAFDHGRILYISVVVAKAMAMAVARSIPRTHHNVSILRTFCSMVFCRAWASGKTWHTLSS
jgi:hypothetical protein